MYITASVMWWTIGSAVGGAVLSWALDRTLMFISNRKTANTPERVFIHADDPNNLIHVKYDLKDPKWIKHNKLMYYNIGLKDINTLRGSIRCVIYGETSSGMPVMSIPILLSNDDITQIEINVSNNRNYVTGIDYYCKTFGRNKILEGLRSWKIYVCQYDLHKIEFKFAESSPVIIRNIELVKKIDEPTTGVLLE